MELIVASLRQDKHGLGGIPRAVDDARLGQRLWLSPCHRRPKNPTVALKSQCYAPRDAYQRLARQAHTGSIDRAIFVARNAPPALLWILAAGPTPTGIVGVAKDKEDKP